MNASDRNTPVSPEISQISNLKIPGAPFLQPENINLNPPGKSLPTAT